MKRLSVAIILIMASSFLVSPPANAFDISSACVKVTVVSEYPFVAPNSSGEGLFEINYLNKCSKTIPSVEIGFAVINAGSVQSGIISTGGLIRNVGPLAAGTIKIKLSSTAYSSNKLLQFKVYEDYGQAYGNGNTSTATMAVFVNDMSTTSTNTSNGSSPIPSTDQVGDLAQTKISYSTNSDVRLEVKHPTQIECDAYQPPTSVLAEALGSYNCTFGISYRVTSGFFGNGRVNTISGADVGYFGLTTFIGDKYSYNSWKADKAQVTMKESGTIIFTMKNGSFKYELQSPIKVKVLSQAETDAKKISAIKTVSDSISKIQDAKKLTITCKKGKLSKTVTGNPSSCPAGYSAAIAKYVTYKAFASCKLYKKDSPGFGAELTDAGRTLIMNSVGKSSIYNSLSLEDLSCVYSAMKVPGSVISQIDNTRAIDGIQKASFNKTKMFWNYHPDNGLSITFY